MFFLTVIMRGSATRVKWILALSLPRSSAGRVNLPFVSFRGKSHNGRNRLSADRGLSTRFQLHEERGGYIINESRHRFDHQFPEEKEVGERGVSFFIKIIYHRV